LLPREMAMHLTSSLSASDHLSHKSPAAPLLSPTNLKVEHGMAVPGHQASSQQESHSQWRSANGSCIHQTSTYFQSTTSSSLPSSVPKILPSSFESLVDHDQSPHHVQTYKPKKEPTSLSLPVSKDPCPPSQVVSSTDAFQGSSPQAHSPLPPKKLFPWAQVPIHITTHILSPSPTQLPPSLHGSSSNVHNVNSHCSQMPFSGTPPMCRVKSPLPTRLSLLTAILKSGSSPKRPFSPASCPGTFSPNSFDSSTLATEQKFKTIPLTPKKAASQFSIFRSDSPYQDEGYFPGLSDAPRNRMVSSKSSPTLQTWSLSPKRTLDTGARSPDKLRPLSPIICSYRKTVVSPLLKPKLTSFSSPPHVSRQSVLKTREPGKSTKVRTSSPTFAAKSHPAPTFAVNQRPTLSPTAQKLSYSPAPGHSSNQPKEHLRHVSAKDQGTNLSTQWPFYHQDSPSSIPPSCNMNSPLLRTSASSPLHSNFRICSPCSRHKSPPAITPCGSLARKHSPCPQFSRSRQTSSPLSFSLPSDCENKTPQTKPGVIRPTTVKAKIIIKEEEEPVQPNPFRKYLEERSDLQTEQVEFPLSFPNSASFIRISFLHGPSQRSWSKASLGGHLIEVHHANNIIIQ
uniref:Muscular LMNA interacting protein n=1 Tax=Pseudonaja textilis TaxID=8673 RepID=A0A670YLT1_PSETE